MKKFDGFAKLIRCSANPFTFQMPKNGFVMRSRALPFKVETHCSASYCRGSLTNLFLNKTI